MRHRHRVRHRKSRGQTGYLPRPSKRWFHARRLSVQYFSYSGQRTAARCDPSRPFRRHTLGRTGPFHRFMESSPATIPRKSTHRVMALAEHWGKEDSLYGGMCVDSLPIAFLTPCSARPALWWIPEWLPSKMSIVPCATMLAGGFPSPDRFATWIYGGRRLLQGDEGPPP